MSATAPPPRPPAPPAPPRAGSHLIAIVLLVLALIVTVSLEKVKGFYQERIGSLATKVTEKDSQGKTVFEIKHRDQEKVVALENLPSGTRIELVRVIHGRGESK